MRHRRVPGPSRWRHSWWVPVRIGFCLSRSAGGVDRGGSDEISAADEGDLSTVRDLTVVDFVNWPQPDFVSPRVHQRVDAFTCRQ